MQAEQPRNREDLAYKLIQYDEYQDINNDAINSIFAPYQLAVKFAVHPLSDKYRFLVNHSTGSGKTVTSMMVARNFLYYGHKVYVITFNSYQYIKELLSIPELSFVTQDQLKIKKDQPDQVDIINRQIMRKINKQIVFMGYKELFLALFQGGSKLNMELLSRFQGSLIICDEIQNIYNNVTKNSYGASIQILSYVLGSQVHMLYLSATPLNYSNQLGSLLNIMQVQNIEQEQIIELVQKLETQNIFGDVKTVDKGQAFENLMQMLKQSTQVTKTNAIALIQQIMKDKVSFVPEIKKDFPTSSQHGVEYKAIPNIIIQKCNVGSQFLKYMKSQENYLEGDESRKSIQIHPTLDIVQLVEQAKYENSEVLKWMQANNMQLTQSFVHPIITGSYLKAEHISQYSPKLGFLIEKLLQIQTKSFIYVNKIQGFGIDLVVELLKVNGILLFDTNPSNTSICFKCKIQFKQHKQDHEFIPYRAIVVTGSNVNQGEDYLTRFNGSDNHYQPKYQIVLGNIKIKEGYNIMEVNNVFILTLPFNITNYIQVLGRCVRNKSHYKMPKELQYVNNYLLVNTIEKTETLDSKDFQSLLTKQKDSEYYGHISREELDIWEKNLDFKIVQEYEQTIHSQSIDLKYFYPIYLQSDRNPKNEDELIMKSENRLKMLPFTLANYKINNQIPQDLLTDHSEFDLDNFFLMNVSGILNRSIQNRLKQLFSSQIVWEIEKLIDAVKQDQSPPNLLIVPRDVIRQKIYTYKNTHIIDSFIIYSTTHPQMNFFLQGFNKSPQLSIPVLKADQLPINQESLVTLYAYLRKNFPSYVQSIKSKKFPVQRIDVVPQIMSTSHQDFIFEKLLNIFGKTSIITIRQQYEKMIRVYNQTKVGEIQKDTQAVMFISCINFMLPLTYDIISTTNRTGQSQISKYDKGSKVISYESNQSNKGNTGNTSINRYNTIFATGYIVDLNTQVFLSLQEEPSIIPPQRDSIFPSLVQVYLIEKKQLKFIKLQTQIYGVVKQSGMNCMNYDKDALQDLLKKPYASKQEHCDFILKDALTKHFNSIVIFQQFYRVIFGFIDQ